MERAAGGTRWNLRGERRSAGRGEENISRVCAWRCASPEEKTLGFLPFLTKPPLPVLASASTQKERERGVGRGKERPHTRKNRVYGANKRRQKPRARSPRRCCNASSSVPGKTWIETHYLMPAKLPFPLRRARPSPALTFDRSKLELKHSMEIHARRVTRETCPPPLQPPQTRANRLASRMHPAAPQLSFVANPALGGHESIRLDRPSHTIIAHMLACFASIRASGTLLTLACWESLPAKGKLGATTSRNFLLSPICNPPCARTQVVFQAHCSF